MEYSVELFNELESTNVENAIDEFVKQRDKLLEFSEKDAVRSAAFYAAFKRLSNEFIETVKEREFPVMTEYLWGYEVDFDNTRIELSLVKYLEDSVLTDDGKECPAYFREDAYSLLRVEAKLLSVDEYASNYGIDPKTVTQWIRRGKIRTAKKIGNTWMIPEITDIPSRGYTSASYMLDTDVRPLSDEYPFLLGIDHIHIEQDDNNKTNYIINCYRKFDINDEESMHPISVQEFSQKEKEKFELGLIAHPAVRYVPDFKETIIPDFARAFGMFNQFVSADGFEE